MKTFWHIFFKNTRRSNQSSIFLFLTHFPRERQRSLPHTGIFKGGEIKPENEKAEIFPWESVIFYKSLLETLDVSLGIHTTSRCSYQRTRSAFPPLKSDGRKPNDLILRPPNQPHCLSSLSLLTSFAVTDNCATEGKEGLTVRLWQMSWMQSCLSLVVPSVHCNDSGSATNF